MRQKKSLKCDVIFSKIPQWRKYIQGCSLIILFQILIFTFRNACDILGSFIQSDNIFLVIILKFSIYVVD